MTGLFDGAVRHFMSFLTTTSDIYVGGLEPSTFRSKVRPATATPRQALEGSELCLIRWNRVRPTLTVNMSGLWTSGQFECGALAWYK